MRECIDIAGLVFGRLTAISPTRDVWRRRLLWNCQCSCGKSALYAASTLRKGGVKSCGCLRKEGWNRSHGMAKTYMHRIWLSMLSRCYAETNAAYDDYGGRGIKVCKRWHKLENFYSDMGQRPSSLHSIDRINNGGNYTPSNCRWATKKEQGRNKRNNKMLFYHGKKRCLSEIAEIAGIKRHVLASRIRIGWPLEDAINAPVGSRRNKL